MPGLEYTPEWEAFSRTFWAEYERYGRNVHGEVLMRALLAYEAVKRAARSLTDADKTRAEHLIGHHYRDAEEHYAQYLKPELNALHGLLGEFELTRR